MAAAQITVVCTYTFVCENNSNVVCCVVKSCVWELLNIINTLCYCLHDSGWKQQDPSEHWCVEKGYGNVCTAVQDVNFQYCYFTDIMDMDQNM